MQRRVLLGAGAVAVAVVVVLGLRSGTHRQISAAEERTLAEIVAALPPGTTLAHGATDYNPLTGTLTVHQLVLTATDGSLLTADAMTLSGVEPQTWRAVFDSAAYPDGHPAWTARRLLIADASLSGVHLTGKAPGGEAVTIASVTLHRLSARPFVLPPTPENRRKPLFQADAALAVALDSLDMRGLAADSHAGASAAARIESFVVSDYDGGKLGSASLKAMVIDAHGKKGKPVHATLASITLKNADLRASLAMVRQTGQGGAATLSKSAYGSFDLAGLDVTTTDGPHIGLQSLQAEQVESDGGAPQGGKGSMQGLTLALGATPMPPAAQAGLAAFGMNSLTMDVDVASRMSDGGRTTDLTEDLVLRDLATLHIKGVLSGYDAALIRPDKPFAALQAATIDHATLILEDHSLVDRLFAVAAAQLHTTKEMVVSQLAMPLVTVGLMIPDQPDAADQLSAFLSHPHTLTVTLHPPQGMTLGQVAAAPATERAHLLGVHIAAQ